MDSNVTREEAIRRLLEAHGYRHDPQAVKFIAGKLALEWTVNPSHVIAQATLNPDIFGKNPAPLPPPVDPEILERLTKHLRIAVGNASEEESRSHAVLACRLIVEHRLVDVDVEMPDS
jgi:hypothetical protein